MCSKDTSALAFQNSCNVRENRALYVHHDVLEINILFTAGEPQEPTAAAIRQLEERWDRLSRSLTETRMIVDRNFETKKFSTELLALLELIAGYEKWVGNTEKIAEEAQEITKQLDQCRVSEQLLQ